LLLQHIIVIVQSWYIPHTKCCFVTYASFVLYWIYDPTRISGNYMYF